MKAFCLAGVAAAALAFASASWADPPCDGQYPSWGRVCQGGAYVTAKTIEWYSSFSSCKPSPYEVIASDLTGPRPFVAYRFKKRSKACLYEVMEIGKVDYGDDYWSVDGYMSLKDYRERHDDPAIRQSCPLGAIPSQQRCNLPFAREKKPKPLPPSTGK
jgi:hypothetical protein